MTNPICPIEKNQTFSFSCSPQVPCFNACCRDLNQVLTPYDVLCLKNHLNMRSREFLGAFTQESTGPETGFPVVSLRFGDSKNLTCPFVTDAGCRVYPARPASCRTYPLARGVSRNRVTGKLTEQWAIIREPHCLGFNKGEKQTINDWVTGQQIAQYNLMNDKMLELISLKNRLLPGPLKPVDKQKVYRALYDLDTFRAELVSTDRESAALLDEQTLETALSDDRNLLIAAMKWVGTLLVTFSSEKEKK